MTQFYIYSILTFPYKIKHETLDGGIKGFMTLAEQQAGCRDIAAQLIDNNSFIDVIKYKLKIY